MRERNRRSRKLDKEGIPVAEGSGNVFADLGFPNATDLSLKAELARQIYNRIKHCGLSQWQASKRLKLNQADVSRLMNGHFTGFSADRLMALLNALGVDVEITLRSQDQHKGRRGIIRVLEAA